MKTKIVKETAEYTVLKRADGRYAVKDKNRKYINGDDKVKILQSEGLHAAPKPKPAEEGVSEEAPAEA